MRRNSVSFTYTPIPPLLPSLIPIYLFILFHTRDPCLTKPGLAYFFLLQFSHYSFVCFLCSCVLPVVSPPATNVARYADYLESFNTWLKKEEEGKK